MKTKLLILIVFFITLIQVKAASAQSDYRVSVNAIFQQIDATVINYTDETISCSGLVQAWTKLGRFETHFFTATVPARRSVYRFFRIQDYRDSYQAFPNHTIRCR